MKENQFQKTFDEVIWPLAVEFTMKDYTLIRQKGNEDEIIDFLDFRDAFKSRLKLHFFQIFSGLCRINQEVNFIADLEHLKKDIFFLYTDFKHFFRQEKERKGEEPGFFNRLDV